MKPVSLAPVSVLALALLASGASVLHAANPAIPVPAGKNHAPRVGGGAPKPTVPCFLRTASSPTGLRFYWPGAPPGAIWFGPVPICAGDDPAGSFSPRINPPRPRPPANPPGGSSPPPPPKPPSIPVPPLSPGPSGNRACPNHQTQEENCSGSSGPAAPSSIREWAFLDIAPNQPGLGMGELLYYVDGPKDNFGSPDLLAFNSVVNMEAKRTAVTSNIPPVVTHSRFEITQPDGSAISFLLKDSITASGQPHPCGLPESESAAVQAGVTWVNPGTGAVTGRVTGAELRQYLPGYGVVHFPRDGGLATGLTTTTGRYYSFPGGAGSLNVEIIRRLPGGGLGVNGTRLSGSLRQIKTPAGLLDIVPTVSGTFAGREFEILQYSASQVGPAKVSGLWPVTGSPVFTIKISAPAGTTNQATVVRTLGTERYTTTHTVVVSGGGNTQTWTQNHINGSFQFRRKLVSTLTSGTNRTSTWTGTLLAAPGMSIPANPPASYTLVNNTKNHFPVSSEETFGSGVVIKREQSFDPPGADPEVPGQPVEVSDLNNPGYKIYAEYSITTRRMNYRRWAMTAPGGGGSMPTSRQENFDYTPLMPEDPARLFDFRPRKATRTYNNATDTVGVEYFAYPVLAGEYTEIRERAVSLGAAFGASGALRTEIRYYGPGANQGRPRRARAEDGTVTLYSYTDLPGGKLQALVTQNLSSTETPVSGHSTRTTFLLNVSGRPEEITNACYLNTGSWLDYEKYTCTWDNTGNPLVTTRTDLVSTPNQVRVIEEREWDGVRLTRHTDDAGVVTVYEYHPETVIPSKARRLAVAAYSTVYPAQPEIVTTYTGEFTLDSQQLPLRRELISTTEAGTGANYLSLTEKVKWDETGRVVRIEDADGNVTGVEYSSDRSTATVTYPGGGKEISTFSPDGHLIRVTGDGVVPSFHHHASLPGGGGTRDTVYTGTDNSSRYATTERDLAGRTAKVKRPALLFNTTPPTVTVSETNYHYNTTGHLWKVASTGQPNLLYEYNNAGDLYRTAVSANDTMDFVSDTDNITEESSLVQVIDGSPWLVTISEVYLPGVSPPLPATGAKKTVSTERTMLAGFTGTQVSVNESLDTAGNVYRTTETLMRAESIASVTSVRPGASSNDAYYYHAGRLTMHRPSASSGSIHYGYDALGRMSSVEEPQHANSRTIAYEAGKNRVWKVTDTVGAVTEYVYHPSGPGTGQVRKITAPNSAAVRFTYDLIGRTTGASGGAAYPVAYSYTDYGELHTLTTWRGDPVTTVGDVTTWTREPATGLLLSKKDAASQEIKYTYDIAGRLKTRLSPRGITATYNYYSATGRLQDIIYTPVATANTPTSGFEYDRLGRMTKMTQGGHSWTYDYDPDKLVLDTETVSYDTDSNGTGDLTRVIDRSTDSLLRPDGWTLKTDLTATATTEYTYELTYQPADGRLHTVSGGGNTFTYGYDYPSSAPHRLRTVTGPGGMVTTNLWHPNRDALESKENKHGSTVKSKYAYFIDSMGRRDSVSQTGEAFGTGSFIDWGYNSRSELTMQDHTVAARDFVYEFDNIGNRTKAAGGLVLPGASNHNVNNLNQYTLIGGKIPTYDADGNLRTDGGGNEPGLASRTYSWDGENRLIQVTNTTAGTAYYRYDPLGRRHSKNTGGTTTWYIYDGWNLIGEYQSGTLQRAHVWGLDLSGTLQGAGGVGGLLCTHIAGAKYYPLYDGNGNVTQYLNGSGTMVARYEYSAYGYLLDWGGTLADSFEFRFSTKKLDFETGLYYYGYRYYSPWMARWINRDPMFETTGRHAELLPEGPNLYLFVGNDSLNWFDHMGLSKIKDPYKLAFKGFGNIDPGPGQWANFTSNVLSSKKWKKAIKDTVNYFDLDGNGKLNKKDCPPFRIRVVGYSWGGWSAVLFSQKIGEKVDNPDSNLKMAVGTLDPVDTLRGGDGELPAWVRSGTNIYQTNGCYRGCFGPGHLYKGNPITGAVNTDLTSTPHGYGGYEKGEQNHDHITIQTKAAQIVRAVEAAHID